MYIREWFQIVKSETLCIHFCQQLSPCPDPEILLDKTIKVVTEANSFWRHIFFQKSCGWLGLKHQLTN